MGQWNTEHQFLIFICFSTFPHGYSIFIPNSTYPNVNSWSPAYTCFLFSPHTADNMTSQNLQLQFLQPSLIFSPRPSLFNHSSVISILSQKKNPPHLRGATFFVQTHVISCLPCCNILLSKSMPFSLLFLCLNHSLILLLKDRLSLVPHSRVPFVKGLGQPNGSGDWQESGQMGMGIYQECSENHIPWGTSTGTEIRSCNV